MTLVARASGFNVLLLQIAILKALPDTPTALPIALASLAGFIQADWSRIGSRTVQVSLMKCILPSGAFYENAADLQYFSPH